MQGSSTMSMAQALTILTTSGRSGLNLSYRQHLFVRRAQVDRLAHQMRRALHKTCTPILKKSAKSGTSDQLARINLAFHMQEYNPLPCSNLKTAVSLVRGTKVAMTTPIDRNVFQGRDDCSCIPY